MPKFIISFDVLATGWWEGEAQSPEEARLIAWDEFHPDTTNSEFHSATKIIDVAEICNGVKYPT